ncbi:hypothetical protein KKF05_02970 [Patescibacteria group bacterium]|nr:hypothetical protein [Patescibacteria group bacterium]MBU1028602.1 hypothetical protein [Patescibacteria group bacterium]MBU1915567.1 hypothetical protein [Patescibacteria group bacterium]
MAQTRISGNDVWQVVEGNTLIMDVLPTPDHRAAMQLYVTRDLLVALEHLLDQPASLATLLTAQIIYAQTAVSSGLTRRLSALDMGVTEDEVPFFIDDLLAGWVRTAVSILQPIADNSPGCLEQLGTTEREQLEATNLTAENVERILNRELTIADILLIQPDVIFNPIEQ